MKFLFSILFFIGFLQLSAQSEEQLLLRSKAKTVVIELASLNKLVLTHTAKEDTFVLRFNNHSSYKKPILHEKNDVVEIKVAEEKDYLPGSQQNKYRAGQPVYPNYVVEVPGNVDVKIVYKKGNFKTHDFVGNLAIYLDHGIVDLTGIKGSVFVQSYSGIINCRLQDTSITVETSKGKINSEINDEKLVATKTSLTGIYGNPFNKLHIKTVNAKVNLLPLVDK